MSVIVFPCTFRFGLAHPDTVCPEGFMTDEHKNEFLCYRQLATGHLFMASFDHLDKPHILTRLTRYRLPTAEEMQTATATGRPFKPGRFILDKTETIFITPASPSLALQGLAAIAANTTLT